MITTLHTQDVMDCLQKAAGIVPTKSGSASLRSLWLRADNDQLTVMATDANIEFTGVCKAQVKQSGLFGVNGRNLVELIRRLPAGEFTLRLEAGAGSLLVEQGRKTYKMPANDATWFNEPTPFPTENSVIWSADFFAELIDRVLFCVSDNEASDSLACMYMAPVGDAAAGLVDVCGLNGHQFARVSFTNDELAAHLPSEGLLLQKKYAAELRKWLNSDDIELNVTPKRLFLRTVNGKECLSLPRSIFTYPDYTAFLARLEKNASRLILDRKDAHEALDRISIFNTEADRCVYLDLIPTEMTLSAQGQETGSANEHEMVNYDGTMPRVVFPTKSLMEILTHFNSPKLTFTLTGHESPCGITGDQDENYIVLIMPVKIADHSYYSEE